MRRRSIYAISALALSLALGCGGDDEADDRDGGATDGAVDDGATDDTGTGGEDAGAAWVLLRRAAPRATR